MKPLRMCMVCRGRFEKKDLIRIAKNTSQGIFIDPTGKSRGRGAYICRQENCIKQAQKRKALERAFSSAINPDIYQELLNQTEDN